MKSKEGQLAPNTIVGIIVAVAILVSVLLFFTGRFQSSTRAFSELSPQDFEVAISSCQFACDTANAAASSSANLDIWQAKYCNKQVSIGNDVSWCEGMPLNPEATNKYHCNPKFNNFACPTEQQGLVAPEQN